MKWPTFAGLTESSVVRKVLATLTVGGGVYLVTNILHLSNEWSIVLPVFIGGVVLVVQFLVEFDNRMRAVALGQDRHFQTVENLITGTFESISEATELFGRVETSAMHTDLVKQLVRHTANLDRSAHQLMHLFAHAEITRVSELMKGLSDNAEKISILAGHPVSRTSMV